MFDKYTQEPQNKHDIDILIREVESKKQQDPLYGAKICAEEMLQRMVASMKKNDPKGLQIETLIVCFASLGGFACQMALREGLLQHGTISHSRAFNAVKKPDGSVYYAGDLLNDPLFLGKMSLFAFANARFQRAGVRVQPDFKELTAYVQSTFGTAKFGIPRFPEGHRVNIMPLDWVKAFWESQMSRLQLFCADPVEWPGVYGIVLQKAFFMGRDVLQPQSAMRLAMESAVPMAHINPDLIMQTSRA